MIRTAVFAAVALAAASPALAFEHTTAAAPKDAPASSFIHLGAVEHLAPEGATEPFHMGPHEAQQGQTVVYELPKGKPADRIDANDPRDNPFMPQAEHAPAAAPTAEPAAAH